MVAEPMEVQLPKYFERRTGINIVQNTHLGFDIYESEKPVKSIQSQM